MKQLEVLFWERGYRNHNGKKIAHSTMSGMISNPKYKGYYVGNKVKVVDMFTKKQKFLPPEEWVMFKDETGEIVPSIVSEELWDSANEVLARRSEDVKNRKGICNHANLLTGKLFCTCCGTPYYRRESKDKLGNKNSKWVCSGKINNGADSCASFAIYEDEIKPLIFDVFRDTQDVSDAMILEYEKMYRSMISDGNLSKKISEQEAIADMARKKKSKLLELTATGKISDDDFAEMTNVCNKELKEAETILADLKAQEESSEDFRVQMERIRQVLKDAQNNCVSGAITKEFVETFIDKIYVTPENDGTMRLDIKIFTGDACEKYLNKLKTSLNSESRTGHTFKKMIEKYENDLSAK